MSVAHTTTPAPAPAADAAGEGRRTSLLRWLPGGALAAAGLAAVAIAVWPASEAELDIALTDLTNQAEDFRTTGPEVQQAYWDGYEAGLEG